MKKTLFSGLLLGCLVSFSSCRNSKDLKPQSEVTNQTENATIPNFPSTILPNLFNDDTKVSFSKDANNKYTVTFKSNITFPVSSNTVLDNISPANPRVGTSPGNGDGYDNDLRSFSIGNERGFYWKVPTSVIKIIINSGVTIRGGFRSSGQNLSIEGATTDRTKHVITGTDLGLWKGNRTAGNTNEWKYTMIEGVGGGLLTVKNITVQKARAYNINSYDTKIVASNILLKTGRDVNETQGNNDGFGGGPGSTITDSEINVTDDGIKFYKNDQVATRVKIFHNKNGAPIQFGWNTESGATGCKLIDCEIVRNSSVGDHNLAPFTLTNRSATQGNLNVSVSIQKGNNGGIEGLVFTNGNYSNKKILSQFSNQPLIPLIAARTSKTTTPNNASITINGKNNISGFTSSDSDWKYTQGACSITLNN